MFATDFAAISGETLKRIACALILYASNMMIFRDRAFLNRPGSIGGHGQMLSSDILVVQILEVYIVLSAAFEFPLCDSMF